MQTEKGVIGINIKNKSKDTAKLFAREAFGFVRYMVVAAITVSVVTKVFFPFIFVPTSSMENEIPREGFVFCNKVRYWKANAPKRGDVVLFKRMELMNDDKLYVKRVVGLPGEKIEIIDGITYIDGKKYEETWLKEEPKKENFGPFYVPLGYYFCMGDNRNNSYDCRYWQEHYISEEDIEAKCNIVISGKGINFIDDHHE